MAEAFGIDGRVYACAICGVTRSTFKRAIAGRLSARVDYGRTTG
jgi:hypothetical protein